MDFRTPKAEQAALDKGSHVLSKHGEMLEYGYVTGVLAHNHITVRLYSVRWPDGYVSVRNRTDLWPIDEATFEWVSDCDWQISAMPADLWANVRDRLEELDGQL